jgi:hypothetical protein
MASRVPGRALAALRGVAAPCKAPTVAVSIAAPTPFTARFFSAAPAAPAASAAPTPAGSKQGVVPPQPPKPAPAAKKGAATAAAPSSSSSSAPSTVASLGKSLREVIAAAKPHHRAPRSGAYLDPVLRRVLTSDNVSTAVRALKRARDARMSPSPSTSALFAYATVRAGCPARALDAFEELAGWLPVTSGAAAVLYPALASSGDAEGVSRLHGLVRTEANKGASGACAKAGVAAACVVGNFRLAARIAEEFVADSAAAAQRQAAKAKADVAAQAQSQKGKGEKDKEKGAKEASATPVRAPPAGGLHPTRLANLTTLLEKLAAPAPAPKAVEGKQAGAGAGAGVGAGSTPLAANTATLRDANLKFLVAEFAAVKDAAKAAGSSKGAPSPALLALVSYASAEVEGAVKRHAEAAAKAKEQPAAGEKEKEKAGAPEKK